MTEKPDDVKMLLEAVRALLVKHRINALNINREMEAVKEAYEKINGGL